MLDSIKIKIKDDELIIKKSYRALMLFEEMSGKAIDQMKVSVSDIMLLFYCILKACNKDKFNHTFDEFIDILDENPNYMEPFQKYLVEEGKKVEKTSVKKKPKVG